MREFASLGALQQAQGELDLARSQWLEVTQQRIDLFAEATGDHQWIHVDAERCAKESPYGAPIAHGFLSLSLIPIMLEQAIRILPAKMGLNYGLNKVRFPAPVRAGSRVRGQIGLLQVEEIENGAQLTWKVSVEIEGGEKLVCVAELVTRVYW